jgi:hypothetical protein
MRWNQVYARPTPHAPAGAAVEGRVYREYPDDLDNGEFRTVPLMRTLLQFCDFSEPEVGYAVYSFDTATAVGRVVPVDCNFVRDQVELGLQAWYVCNDVDDGRITPPEVYIDELLAPQLCDLCGACDAAPLAGFIVCGGCEANFSPRSPRSPADALALTTHAATYYPNITNAAVQQLLVARAPHVSRSR